MTSTRGKQARQSRTGTLTAILIGAGLVIFGIAVLLYLPSISSTGNVDNSLGTPARVNYPAPKLYLSDLNGEAVSLDDFKGKVILLNNWATWCPPCKLEMPELEAYYQSHSGDDFVVVAIEAGDSLGDVKDFVKEYGLTFVVWPDMMTKTVQAFENDSLPSTYLIDRQGNVRLVWIGGVNRAVLEKFVTPFLEE